MIANLTDAMVIINEQAATIKQLREALAQKTKELGTTPNTGSPKLLDILSDMIRTGNICDRNYHKQALDIIEQLRAGA